MLALLRSSPLLVLFLVAGFGFVVGRIKIAGVGLGVAAVLFAGLAMGAIDPGLALPELVPFLGLVLFVYTVGLSSGPGFFASLAGRGLRQDLLAAGVTIFGALMTLIVARLLGLRGADAAGLFAGATTNTPALAAVLDALRTSGSATHAALSAPVVMYSVCYPLGVLGTIGAIVALRPWIARHPAGAPPSIRPAAHGDSLEVATVRITKPAAINTTPERLRRRANLRVAFGRRKRSGIVSVLTGEEVLHDGDLVTIVGTREELAHAIEILGERSEDRIELDRSAVDFRRIIVSDPRATQRPLSELHLDDRFDAVVTRLRRGDVELLPQPETVLQLGDRVRVVAPRARLDEVAKFFGDSYRAASEIDVITFSVGIAIGLLIGAIPIPIPGLGTLKLGLAGGPLLAGLILGRIGRLGSLVFVPPFGANLTLRQLGLVLFLAGIGTRAGGAFADAIRTGTALPTLAAGATVTILVAAATLIIGRRLMQIPYGTLLGIVAGVQTQPAVLAFASEQTKDDLPNNGYATVYPVVTIVKIVIAQVIVVVLGR
jgi:putative transport protein